jgi:acyl phosphate:glycerol-3-phosphate acyltransferase
MSYAIVILVSYLLGSIPFGLILVRVFQGADVRQIGSGNIGATNVMRAGSKKLGIATLLLDAAKGYAAVYIASGVSPLAAEPDRVWLRMGLAALCAVLGHVFPVWLGFKGGKGVATGVGAFLALAPGPVAIVLVLFVAIVKIFGYVSLGSIVAAAAFPVIASAFLYHSAPSALPFMYAASALIIAKHHENIRRLLAGTENRFSTPNRAKGGAL